MLVTPSGSPLLLAGQQILHTNTFFDDFQRGTSMQHSPLGMGWIDLSTLFPDMYDPARIYNGAVGSGDPYARGKNGATMAPDDDWEHFDLYPGMAMGGISCALRNIGDGIFNYDVSCRISGVLSGSTSLGPESEATPIVGADTASAGVGYGAWLVNLHGLVGFDYFVIMVGRIGNPPEDFFVTHISLGFSHVNGQQRDLTIKYRGTSITVWFDGAQVINFQEYDMVTKQPGTSIGGTIPLIAAHQNKSWVGFECDQHITPPDQITTTPALLSYSHKIITS